MSSNLGNLVATAGLDIAPFMANTRTVNMALRGLDKSLNAMEKSFKGVGKGLAGLSGMKTILAETGKSLEAYQYNLAKQSKHYNDLKREIGDVSTATADQKAQLLGAKSAMTDTIAKVAELQAKYVTLAREINIQSSAWNKAGTAMYDVGSKIQLAGQKLSGVGSALTKGVTAPLVAGAGIAIKAAIDYESAFAGVKKTVDETATVSYAKLSDGIRQMAKELPASAVEIANVAEVAGQLGIKTEDILKFSRTMIDMGESTNLSAEEAATAIAKIANILGLTSEDYSRFGASVVDLGNNFATTEKDIVEMTNRLAAAGKLAGLTAPEVLGLATAMSSVGIEAEAGGTAMTQTLTAIGNAVSLTGKDAEDKLNLIAETAGMTAEEFQRAWKEKPVEALQSFIKGLQNAHNEGKNMNGILDDLDMKGVRQSNMLKSLALASDKMSDAVNRSNTAWKNNTALTDEANKRYATTESQLKMFKNELTDIAIEFGGPLLQALRSGLDAVKPWIANLADMAKAFSAMNTEQQQNIIKWGLMAAAAGPALKILASGMSVFGGIMKVVGGTAKGISTFVGTLKTIKQVGSVAGGLKAVASGLTATGTAATVATGSTSLLAGAVGLLGNPITWGVVLGGAVLLGIGMITNHMREAEERTQRWGTSVSKLQDVELTNFKKKVDETNKAMVDFGAGAGSVDKVVSSFQKLNEEINKLADKKLNKQLDIAKDMGLGEEHINTIKNNASRVKDNVSQMTKEVIDIYRNASEQHRKLTKEEQAVVLANQNELIRTQLDLMKFSGEEKVKITQAMNGQLDELNNAQLKKAKETLEGWAKEENKSYKERKAKYKELLESIQGEDEKSLAARREVKAKMEQLEAEHTAKMEAYGTRWVAIEQKLNAALTTVTPEARAGILNAARKMAEELGFSYDEMAEKATRAMNKIQEGHSQWARTTEASSEVQRAANVQWNSMVWDLKEGKIKTNAQEEIQKALQAEGGWENIKFIAKEANLESNARIAIGEALVAVGQWDSLSPEDKKLVTDGKSAIEAIITSKEMLQTWNEMPEGVKKLLGENSNFMNSATTAKNTLNAWNLLQPTQKALIAEDLASGKVEQAQRAINSLVGTNVPIDATNNTALPAKEATDSINAVTQYQAAYINAVDNTQGQTSSAQKGIDSVKQGKATDINASDNTTSPVANAKRSVNSVSDRTVTISAIDNASGVLSGIGSWLSRVTGNFFTNVFASKHAKGTNFHPGGLALVNDQPGTLYKEMITLPNGHSFIPEGRNVPLPLPRGSKVMKAGLTRNLMKSLGMPLYAEGVGWKNSQVANISQRIKSINEWKKETEQRDLSPLIEELIRQTKEGNKRPNRPNQNYTLNVNSQGGTPELTPEFMQRLIRELAYYIGQEGGRMT